MPTYGYECTVCGHKFERFHGMTEKIEIICPLCGGKSERCISGVGGFILKGTGFYANDYEKNMEKGDHETEKNKEKKNPEK